MSIVNGMNADEGHDLHDALASRAAGLEFGPVPVHAILTGARRRTARRRVCGATLAVLATAGVAAGVVSAGGGPGTAVSVTAEAKPTPTASGTARGTDRFVPKTTQVAGLAPGQTVDRDSGVLADGSHVPPVPQGVVVASGTVDGVPWQLQVVRVVDPLRSDPYFGGSNWWSPPAGKHSYCDVTALYVGHKLAVGRGLACSSEDTLQGAPFTDAVVAFSGNTELEGHEGYIVAGYVRDDVAKVVWSWGDGQSITVVPVASADFKVRFLPVPFGGVTGKVKVVAYDASGAVVGEVPFQHGIDVADAAQASELARIRASKRSADGATTATTK